MAKLKFIWIGRLKAPFWRDASAHYWERLGRHHTLEEACLKDGPAKLPPEKRMAEEGERILARLGPADLGIALDERGKRLTSPQLAELLDSLTLDANRTPCFVVGGAWGLAEPVLQGCRRRLSLGSMTLPHELARVVLLEQLYRATAILKGIPYHHE
jgi:23S rRNA (pseudouridine1915-N3)-methyltransferase